MIKSVDKPCKGKSRYRYAEKHGKDNAGVKIAKTLVHGLIQAQVYEN